MANTIGGTSSDRVLLKLQFEQDYEPFVRQGRVASTLSAIAKILDVSPAEISLLALRSGCTIMILGLTRENAKKLEDYLKARGKREDFPDIEGLTDEQIETLKSTSKVIRVLGAPYFDSGSQPGGNLEPDLSWLHISDLHIKEDYNDPVSDTSADLQRFLDDLPSCLADAEIAPDAIFFTGDVTQSGVAEEYAAAELFFKRLRSELPATSRKAPFLVIPGNHDVHWKDIDVPQEMKMRDGLSKQKFADVVAAFEPHISKRQANYIAFSKKFNGSACNWFDAHAFSHCFKAGPGGLKVGVAGFNSAWLSTRKDLLEVAHGIPRDQYPDLDYESLALGAKQIRKAKELLDESKADIRVALVHHEPRSSWYRGQDVQLQRKELKPFDFVLRGHQHEPQARQGVKVAGRDDFVELAPGALRTRPDYFQGFMAVELDFSASLMRLTAWKPTAVAGVWKLDPDFGNDGVDVRHLPEPLLDRLRGKGHKVLT